MAPVQHHADETEDVVDGRRGPRLAERRQQSQGAHVELKARRLVVGEVHEVDAELARLAQDVVVDVGDVAHAMGLVAEVAQAALDDVVGDVGGGVAEVTGGIRRDAARVHGDDRPGLERHDLLASGVVQADRHCPSSPVSRTVALAL